MPKKDSLIMVDLAYAIQRFTRNAAAIEALFAGVPEEQARWKPDPAAWSLLEVINHLFDEERWDFRMRLDLTLFRPETEWPQIDPIGWVTERRYNSLAMEESLLDFQDERAKSLEWLHDLRTPDWTSTHTFPQVGAMTAGRMLACWLAHDQLHIRQMAELHHLWVGHLVGADALDYAGPW
jgi:hypothetical protein